MSYAHSIIISELNYAPTMEGYIIVLCSSCCASSGRLFIQLFFYMLNSRSWPNNAIQRSAWCVVDHLELVKRGEPVGGTEAGSFSAKSGSLTMLFLAAAGR